MNNSTDSDFIIEASNLVFAIDGENIDEAVINSFKKCVSELPEFAGYEKYRNTFIVDYIVHAMKKIYFPRYAEISALMNVFTKELSVLDAVIGINIPLYINYIGSLYCKSNPEGAKEIMVYLEHCMNEMTDNDSLPVRIGVMKELLGAYLANPQDHIAEMKDLSGKLKVLIVERERIGEMINRIEVPID